MASRARAWILFCRVRSVREIVLVELDVEATRHLRLDDRINAIVTPLLAGSDPRQLSFRLGLVKLAEANRDDFAFIRDALGADHSSRKPKALVGKPRLSKILVRLTFAQSARQYRDDDHQRLLSASGDTNGPDLRRVRSTRLAVWGKFRPRT